MTKEEILKIIDQNKDILTPDNYQRILKNVDILTDQNKEAIVVNLMTARKMMDANEEYLKKQNVLHKATEEKFIGIHKKIVQESKEALHKAEAFEETRSSEEADQLISNL